MDDNTSLFPIFGRLPDDLKDIVCDQVEEFLHQASFLRRADHCQAHLVHTRGIQFSTAEEQVEVKLAEADETVADPAVVGELSVVQSLTTKLPPVLEQDVAASFDNEHACKPQAVHRWFEDRNQALSKACSRARKKYSSTAVTSVSMRGNAVLRSVAPQAEEGIHDASSALAACLSPMSAMETSMKLMSLLQSEDPRQPALKDNSASRAFALVSKCPSIMLQSMLLNSVVNTSGMQLTALDRTDIYTAIAQWLQDAVNVRNDALVQLCLGALWKIPFTEVHIICFARHHMISGTEPEDRQRPVAANNPTILEFVKRLTEPSRPAAVREAAEALLDKWARVERESDAVILTGGPQSQAAVAAAKKKGAKGAPAEAPRPQVFPKDRRMKAPQPISLHRDGRGSAELAKTNTSHMSKAAAQRRVLASTGPLSVSDIKKRKEQQQLMQKLGKKQKSLPGTASSMPPRGPSAALASREAPGSATLRTPADAVRGASVFSASAAQPDSAAGFAGSAASTPLRRVSSAGAPGTGACTHALQSPGTAPSQHGSPLPSDQRRLPEAGSPGMVQRVPGGGGGAGSAELEAAGGGDEPKRGLSSLLQITQDAAAQQVRKRREALPVPWQVAEASLDDARKMMAAVRRGVRFHPEIRTALEAAIAQGDAESKKRWAMHEGGSVGTVDGEAMEALEDTSVPWSPPQAITALSDTLMQICASWAADSTEKAVQREREYLAAPAPGGDAPAEVADVDDVPDVSAAAVAAEAAPRVPFWLQPPPEEADADAWQHFAGRTHMVGIAQAWRSGLRFILGEPGIPTAGPSSADLAASRICDGTEPEPEAQVPEDSMHSAPAATAQPPHSAPAPQQQPYPPALPGPPQQEVQQFQEYQQHHPAAPMQAHTPVVAHAQGGHGGAAMQAYGVMQPVQYDWAGGGGHPMPPGAQGLQYVQHAAPGQYAQQVVYAQPGVQPGGGAPMYGGQYAQPAQQVLYAGQQYQGGQPMYHYVHQGGPGAAEQQGRTY